MRIKRAGLAMIGAWLALGCWGDVKDIYPEGGVDGGSGGGPAAPELYEGGGAGGGPIDGRLNLFAVDEVTGAPIDGARVMLGDDAAGALTGETDGDGLVVFEQAGLTGPLNLHVLAAGYAAESLLGVDALNVTLPLRPAAGVPTPATATIAGTISGVDVLPDPIVNEYQVAGVFYGRPVADLFDAREPRFPAQEPLALVDLEAGDGSYTVTVPAGPGVLYALGGLWRTYGTSSTADDDYEWTHLALVLDLAPGPGEELEDVELELETSLFHETFVRIGILPGLYEEARADLGLDLGAAGSVWLQPRKAGSDLLFAAPPLEGDLADAAVLLVGRAEQVVDAEDAEDPVLTMPQGRRFARDLDGVTGYTDEDPYMIPVLPSPPAQLNWDGAKVSCLPQNGTHLGTVIVEQLDDRAPRWRATIFGPLQPFLEPPSFPDDWDWSGVPATGLLVRAWTAKLSVAPDELRWADFSDAVTDTAHAASAIEGE